MIGAMVSHALASWRQKDVTIYIGCYANDPETVQAAMAGIAEDLRARVVVHNRMGPTTKADCLNRLYEAMERDEARRGCRFSSVILHDSEDMVHPAALVAIDRALSEVDFVQLPVRPIPQDKSPWVAGHYTDEFTESHAKTMVVRNVLGAAMPAAGVGCGFDRDLLGRLSTMRKREGSLGPFASDCLTEDYELGLLVTRLGGISRFLRIRDQHGQLVATSSYFPATLETAVRQKARWIQGISLQSWDRLGWWGGPVNLWMAIRDRRGPLTALVFLVGYVLVLVELTLAGAKLAGYHLPFTHSGALELMLKFCLVGFLWRACFRMAFTAREYGLAEGLRSLLRIPVANVITIMAGRRALSNYVRSLTTGVVLWDKTEHKVHPASREALL